MTKKNQVKIVNYSLLIFNFAALLFFIGCGKEYSEKDKKYIEAIEAERSEKNDYMKNDSLSPFNQDEKAHFSNLKYYEPSPEYVFKSKLREYESKDTVIILGTKGEERKVVKYGYVNLDHRNKNYKVNVYKGVSRTGEEYYSIWFTDNTTGEDTYGVGRYLDFELNDDSDYIYTIDFNKSYNPYCAYSSKFSCAVPTKEDHIDLAIKAGEKNFH